jgi:transcriptional regulator with XRE-family HTH domain
VALSTRHFGRVLLAYRLEQDPPLTQAHLGEILGVTQGQISRVERAVEPVRDLAKLQQWAARLGIPERMLWFRLTDHPQHAFEPPAAMPTLGAIESTGGDDMQRRHLLKLVGGTAAGIGMSALPDDRLSLGDSARLGWADVETIREMTTVYRRLDNRFGGGHARGLTEQYLNGQVLPALRAGRYRSAVERSLLAATAELLQLAGWMAADVGENRSARDLMVQALDMSRHAGDHAFAAEVLAGMSHHAAFLGIGSQAVDLAVEAQREAAKVGVRALSAETLVMEAHGHALNLDTRSASSALSAAERELAAAARADDPPWLAYFDEAYLAAKHAHCLYALGKGREGVAYAERSLQMSGGYARARAFNLTLLATFHADAGEVDQAVAFGGEALDLASEMDSIRTGVYLARLRRALQPYAGSAAVRDYDDLVAVSSRPVSGRS